MSPYVIKRTLKNSDSQLLLLFWSYNRANARDGMIPMLPQETNPLEVPKFYRQIIENLEMRGGHHEAWHSHKRDPSVCWMCDLIEVSKLVVQEMERFISKSALDIETELIDQVFSPEEVTVNYNVDDE